jgi:hypothetical protein
VERIEELTKWKATNQDFFLHYRRYTNRIRTQVAEKSWRKQHFRISWSLSCFVIRCSHRWSCNVPAIPLTLNRELFCRLLNDVVSSSGLVKLWARQIGHYIFETMGELSNREIWMYWGRLRKPLELLVYRPRFRGGIFRIHVMNLVLAIFKVEMNYTCLIQTVW